MLSKILSAGLLGIEPKLVEVETDVSQGLRTFKIVGLPDKAIEESAQRINSVLKYAGFTAPQSKSFKVLVNLAPADIKKEGSLYDLPISIGFLISSQQIKTKPLNETLIVGELSLTGEVKPIRGALLFSILAQKLNLEEIILPKQNAKEAAILKGVRVIGVSNIKEAIKYIEGKINIEPEVNDTREILSKQLSYEIDISQIRGQYVAKRALQIAAAGMHNIFFEGPPGSGKTILAKSIVSILPPLSEKEAIELTQIYSILGQVPKEGIVYQRPFRNPHHTSSETAILGGGNPIKPGEITLAHKGVLFLDEFPEFHRDVLESLRQPIEDGRITIARSKERFEFPANFMLIIACNPCPCGYYMSDQKECVCSINQIQKYRKKISGPIMDRIDLFVKFKPIKHEDITKEPDLSETQKIKSGVEKAREIQKERFKNENFEYNSEIPLKLINKYCKIDKESDNLLKKFMDSGKLSARGYHRVLKVSRTIADIEGSEEITIEHTAEALNYRIFEE